MGSNHRKFERIVFYACAVEDLTLNAATHFFSERGPANIITNPSMSSHKFCLILFLFLDLNLFVEAHEPTEGYDTSFVYLLATNVDTNEEVNVCANYLQFRFQGIAPDAESANPVGLSFWRHLFNETRLCPEPSGSEKLLLYNGTAVPLLYRIKDDGTNCTRRFIQGGSAFNNATRYQLEQLKRYGADNAILLVEKGKHDHLFSNSFDSYVNASDVIQTFFLYTDVFQNEILGLVKGSDVSSLQLRFHRPNPYPIALSMTLMWLLAVGCVTGGGVWALIRCRCGFDL
ncbi:hypothetical protein Y032_0028g1701 [Ancylostoma ceylanicum]|uniref:Uncharacterized protein n=1 Tax=Ancylostoma ceylanicum TaxID=53326 RepID=A0A016UUL4_9BILA|nr:hypothetical protein Y032_0028g1701 [Ancylostoma ceylanicum]